MLSILQNITDNILKFNTLKTVAGVECIFVQDGSVRYRIVILEQVKGNLTVNKITEQISDFPDLKLEIPKDIPIALIVNGRGIIHKKFAIEEETPERVIQMMLPNAKAGDFYFQNYSNSYGNYWSVARKSFIDQLLAPFHVMELNVIACSFGPFHAMCLVPLIPEASENFVVPGFQLKIRSNELYDFIGGESIYQKPEIKIGGEEINVLLTFAYAAALQLLIPGFQKIIANIEVVETQQNELNQKKIFQTLGWSVLGFFLVVLLVNFFFFSIISNTNQLLLQKQNRFQGMLSDLSSLEKEVKEKETFLGNAGWLGNSRATLFADRIAGTIPPSVTLTALTVYPLDNQKSRSDKKIIFDTRHIRIEGICTQPTDLNPWLSRMDQLPEIGDANVSTYYYDTKEGKGSFIITVNVQE